MKTLMHVFIVAPLALIGVAPASAEEARPASSEHVRPAPAAAPVAERGATLQKARDTLKDWRLKLDAYAEKAKTESQASRADAVEDLNKAWTKTRDATARLETASAAEWASAKAEFNKESDAMAASWAKVGR